MLCATVSNRDGGWGGIVINRFDSEGTILLFCWGGTFCKQYQLCVYIVYFNHLLHMYKSWSVVFRSTLSLTCSRRSVKTGLSDWAWMRTYPTLFAHSAPPKRRKPPTDRSVALQPSQACHLVTTPMPQPMSCTPPMSITVNDHDYQYIVYLYICDVIFLWPEPMDSYTAIQRPGFFPYAVTLFLGGPLFHFLLCNGPCLYLLMDNSNPH